MSARAWAVTGTRGADAPRGDVTVDDAALFTARFDGGATGVFEATRFALGRKNALRIEINGTDGSLAFDFEENNLLQFFDGTQPVDGAGLPADPGDRAGAPLRQRLVAARATGSATSTASPTRPSTCSPRSPRTASPEPSFDGGLRVQRVLGRSRG